VHGILLLLMNYAPMVAIYSGMMRHGATKMKKNLSFGQMARQVVAGYETAKAKVDDFLEII
jgi:hypothetical protein